MTDTWEPAESVAKNAAGEYQALIGGQWLPAAQASKNEAGEYRVIRQAAALETRPTPVNAGIANFIAGLAGAPVDIAQGVYNVPKMLYGLAKGAMGGTDLPEPVTGTPGGSESIRHTLNTAADMTGIRGLSTENPTPESKAGTAAYDFTSRGGAVPGAALPAAVSMVAEKLLGPDYASLGALVPSVATAAYNTARAPALAAARERNAVRDATLKDAQDAGYKTIPSQVNPSVAGNALESFAGKAALKQGAELDNQLTTNRLVREELKIPPNTAITEELLGKLRNDASEPYRQVAALSAASAKALESLRDARSQAKDQWRHWDMQGVPDAKRQAQALDSKAKMLETFIERQAVAAGKPELVPQLRAAREYIAKSYDVERALNIGDANVDAKIIGRAMDRGRPLTANLAIIAKFAEGPGRQVTREAGKVPTPGVSGLNWPMAAALGAEGAHYFGPTGLALAGIPFVRGGVRQGLLSGPYQRMFARPYYEPGMLPQDPAHAGASALLAGPR